MDFIAQNGQIVIYTAYALVFGATFLVARMLFKEQEAREAEQKLEEGLVSKDVGFLLKISKPLFSHYVVPMVRGKELWANQRKDYRRKLIAAGLRDELTADQLISYKFFLVIFFPVVLGLLKSLDMIDLSAIAILATGIGGWFYPDLWIKSRITSRQKKIRNALPFIVDLLALSTEAGLDFVGAIGRVVEKSAPSPLVDELEQVLREIRVGSSRQQALKEMAERVDMSEVNSFVAILVSADQMGASIGKILRQQSDQIRSERFVRAEKEGAKALPKLMLVTVILIFPTVILMVVSPFILSFVLTGRP